MEIYIITLSLILEHMELNFQMNYIIIYQENLHGRQFLELDYLKDGLN